MQREGKMGATDKQRVWVHISDPEAVLLGAFGLEGGSETGVLVESWVVGENVSTEQYEKFLDPETQALYAFTSYESGERRVYLVRKEIWDATRAM